MRVHFLANKDRATDAAHHIMLMYNILDKLDIYTDYIDGSSLLQYAPSFARDPTPD